MFSPSNWTFGGGTVLMRRFRHRFSQDVDIFVPDPQYLGYLDPELNDAVAATRRKKSVSDTGIGEAKPR